MLGGAVITYALLCAQLLVSHFYIGLAAAVAPGLAVVPLYTPVARTSTIARRAGIAWLLLLVTALSWQTVAITADGAISPGSESDAAKFVVTSLAVGLAFLVRVPRVTYTSRVRMLLGYGVIASIGGFLGTDPSSSLERAIRFGAVVIALTWVASRLPRRRVASLFVLCALAFSLMALAARLAGRASSYVYGGRLDGYLPPLHPNALGLLAAGGLLCTVTLIVRRELTLRAFVLAAPVLSATLALTESRSSMIALVVGLLGLACLHMRRRGPLIVGTLLFMLLIAISLQMFTHLRPLTSLLTHNESTSTTGSLASRLSEWDTVKHLNGHVTTRAFGQGLATKTVEVNLRSAQYASVDGTWPAAYLSAGAAGVLILAAAVVLALRAAIRHRDDLAVPIILFLFVNSLVADVFNDVTLGLVLFLSLGVSDLAVHHPLDHASARAHIALASPRGADTHSDEEVERLGR
jgi:hypothetical protein